MGNKLAKEQAKEKEIQDAKALQSKKANDLTNSKVVSPPNTKG